MKHSLYIVIPIYNESLVIGGVISGLGQYGYKNIIVVDDGSTDDSFKIAKKTGVIVFRHKLNRGKGAAIKTGMEAAKLLGADTVVSFDGDGQHNPSDIKRMLSYLERGNDAVLGSRFIKKMDIPLMKRLGNYFANILTYFLYGIFVTDSQSGLRVYGKNALDVIDTQSNRYEFDTEVLREIHIHKLSFIEVPIHVRYTEYSQNKENRQHMVSWLKTTLRLVLSA